MKQFARVLLMSGIALVITTGCGGRTAPIYNVEQATITTATGKEISADEIRTAIIRAGGSLGWVVKEVKPGHLLGTLNIRKHMAQVDVTYNPTSFSIHYKDSAELNYDGGRIHPNYNGWVQNLQRRIAAEVSML